jgi:hypothetical protein
MCLGALASCNTPGQKNPSDDTDGNETGAGATTAGQGGATTDETTDGETTGDDLITPVDPFPETLEYVILSRSSTSYEFETPTGNSLSGVDQAVYNRNAEVMERTNVEISVIPAAGEWNDRGSFMQTVRTDSKLTSSEYSLIATHSGLMCHRFLAR